MSVVAEKADLSLKYISHFNEARELLFDGSADILNQYRKRAFQDFIRQGIPSRKNENYKYTNLQPKFLPDFKFIHKNLENDFGSNAAFGCNIPQFNAHPTLLVNGWFRGNNTKPAVLPKGVILESLEKVAKNNAEMLQNHYAQLADTSADPMVALNTAIAKDGFFLYIPKNVIVENPIQIINTLKSDCDTFSTQRNLVIVERGAEVKLIVCDYTADLNQYLNNSVTEIFVAENANFEFYTVQNQHNKTTGINSVYVKQQRDSNISLHTVSLHGGLIRNNLQVVIGGENAEANMFGMAFLDKNQHIDNFTQVIHAKPHCQSNQLYKYILDDKSTGAFSGKIHVVRDAQKTNAFQRNNNLLLTDTSTMQTKPQLIIDADDVKCSHGATVGQLDEQAMFYLRARGINEEKARMIMMNAFAHEVAQQIKVEALRERIDELIEKRLKGEVSRCHECAYNCEC